MHCGKIQFIQQHRGACTDSFQGSCSVIRVLAKVKSAVFTIIAIATQCCK